MRHLQAMIKEKIVLEKFVLPAVSICTNIYNVHMYALGKNLFSDRNWLFATREAIYFYTQQLEANVCN